MSGPSGRIPGFRCAMSTTTDTLLVSFLPAVLCPRRAGAVLCGIGGVPERLCGCMVDGDSCPSADDFCRTGPRIAAIGDMAAETIQDGLDALGRCAEIGRGAPSPEGLRGAVAMDGLYMALSTFSAHAVDAAHLFAAALTRRLFLKEGLAHAVETALHEAVVNAIVHGNLGMGSADRETVDGFARYCAQIESRLSDPGRADKWIEIAAQWTASEIVATVTDQGLGYRPGQGGAEEFEKSGRGLRIVRALTRDIRIDEGGRRIVMRFSR